MSDRPGGRPRWSGGRASLEVPAGKLDVPEEKSRQSAQRERAEEIRKQTRDRQEIWCRRGCTDRDRAVVMARLDDAIAQRDESEVADRVGVVDE